MSGESYNRVGSRIWMESWDDDTRLLALYLLTCKHRPTEGIYHLPLAYGRADLGWTAKRYERAFQVLLRDGFIEWDNGAEVVLIVKALKWQAPANENQMKAADKKLLMLPATTLRERFQELAETYAPAFAEHLANGSRNGSGNG